MVWDTKASHKKHASHVSELVFDHLALVNLKEVSAESLVTVLPDLMVAAE